MVSLSEGYKALAAGVSADYRAREDDLKELQRRQLILAALTPVAQGVGQFATDLISAPFKEAAANFYRRGAGQGFNARVSAFKSKREDALNRYSEIQKVGHRAYYKPLEDEALKMYDAEMLSSGIKKDSPLYSEGLSDLYKQIRDAQDKEFKEVQDEVAYFKNASTPAEIDAAIQKYSPYPTNLASWFVKKAKRLVTGQSKEDVEKAAIKKLETHLNLTKDEANRVAELNRLGSDYYFSQEVLDSNPIFKNEQFLRERKIYSDANDFKIDILSGGNGGYQKLYNALEAENGGRLVTREQFFTAVQERFNEFLGTDFKDSRESFTRIKATDTNQPEALEALLKDIPSRNEQDQRRKALYESAWDTAQKLLQEKYLSDEALFTDLSTPEGKELFRTSIYTLADDLLKNNIEVVQTEFEGFSRAGKDRLAIAGIETASDRLAIVDKHLGTVTEEDREKARSDSKVPEEPRIDFSDPVNAELSQEYTKELQDLVNMQLTPDQTKKMSEALKSKYELRASEEASKAEGKFIKVVIIPNQAQKDLINSMAAESASDPNSSGPDSSTGSRPDRISLEELGEFVKTGSGELGKLTRDLLSTVFTIEDNPNYVPNEERIRRYEEAKALQKTEEGSSPGLLERLNEALKAPPAAGERAEDNPFGPDSSTGSRPDRISLGEVVDNIVTSRPNLNYVADEERIRRYEAEKALQEAREGSSASLLERLNEMLKDSTSPDKRTEDNPFGPDSSARTRPDNRVDFVDIINELMAQPEPTGERRVGNLLGSDRLVGMRPYPIKKRDDEDTVTAESRGFSPSEIVEFINEASEKAYSLLSDSKAPNKGNPYPGVMSVINNLLDFEKPAEDILETPEISKDGGISDEEMREIDAKYVQFIDKQASDIASVIKNIKFFRATPPALEKLEKSLVDSKYPPAVIALVLDKVKS